MTELTKRVDRKTTIDEDPYVASLTKAGFSLRKKHARSTYEMSFEEFLKIMEKDKEISVMESSDQPDKEEILDSLDQTPKDTVVDESITGRNFWE